MNKIVDFCIIGGGLVGATLAIALKQKGFDCLLIEAQKRESDPHIMKAERSLALSMASKIIFESYGLWEKIAPFVHPIDKIHVSNQGRYGHFLLEDKIHDPLGFIIKIPTLYHIILDVLAPLDCTLFGNVVDISADKHRLTVKTNENKITTIQSKYSIAADGANSFVRERLALPKNTTDYQHTAILTDIELPYPHDNVAFERFTPNGALALLPTSTHRYGLVWITNPTNATHLLTLSKAAFIKELHKALGYRFPKMELTTELSTHHLSETIMEKSLDLPIIFMGNAAHTLHPIAGQGFNLGLRDIYTFTQQLNVADAITPQLFDRYATIRDADLLKTMQFTHRLLAIFESKSTVFQQISSLGLAFIDHSDTMKERIQWIGSGLSFV